MATSIQIPLKDGDEQRGITRRWIPAKTIIEKLEAIRNDPSLWKVPAIGGQDQYAGMPVFLRNIDEIISILKDQTK